MADASMKTPLYELHRAGGARFVDFAGWQMPIQFSGVKAEHAAVRGNAGLFDVSHMGQLLVSGRDALRAVNRLITNDLERLTDGRALYTCCCNHEGFILDDLIVYRLSETEILTVCNASNLEKIRTHYQTELAAHGVPGKCALEDQSAETALIAIQGPNAGALLAQLNASTPALKRFEIASVELEGSTCRVARTGYTGEDGFEVFCLPEVSTTIWRRLLSLGASPIGLAARDTLRLEASLSLYGNDIDETTTPLDARLGWTVKWQGDFIGKTALLAQKARGIEQKLVGFEMIGRGIARAGYPLLMADGSPAGRCTSGSPAPTLGKNIGLGYLPTSLAEPGTRFLVDCRGKQIPAIVVKTPFYKRNVQ